jgi:uncharacterized membrane protein (UPF0127 family)
MKLLTLTIPQKSVTLGSRIGVADRSLTRLFGLLGRRSLEPGSGLLIQPSSGVHTFFMLFPIDVVALDRNLRVLAVWRRLPPWRITPISLKSSSSLELAPGEIDRCGIEPGDQLAIAG